MQSRIYTDSINPLYGSGGARMSARTELFGAESENELKKVFRMNTFIESVNRRGRDKPRF